MRVLFIFLFSIISITSFAQVSISYDGSQPATHTILDINSDTTGLLIPRMTTTQRNTLATKLDAAHVGMVVFDKTANLLFFWDGTEFIYMRSGIVSEIADTDNDTYISVEEGVDPDYINFNTFGTNFWRMKDGRLEFLNTGGSVLIGENAGFNDDFTSNDNVFVGSSAGYATTTGVQNVAMGRSTLSSNVAGNGNTGLGSFALLSNTGSYNVSLGLSSMYFNSTGQNNTALGTRALMSNTTGSNNAILGYYADYYNQTGSNNTVLGFMAGYVGSTNSKSGNIFIGHQAGYSETGSNKLYIQNSNTTNPLIYGDFALMQLGFLGDVGIGTKNPASNLHIMGSSTLASLLLTPNPLSSSFERSGNEDV